MSIPSSSELSYYVGQPSGLTDSDWSKNFNQIIEWLTNGNYELTVKSVNAETIVATTSITAPIIGSSTSTIYGSVANSGIFNPILNGDFETDLLGWATYNDGAGSTPVNGTGGTATITFTRSTVSPLFGLASGLLTKDASNRQGQGFSYDFTIPLGLTSQDLTLTFYSNAGGTYALGDVSVFIYDIAGSVLIPVSVPEIAGGITRHTANFTSTASTSYRLIYHIASTSTNAYTLSVDSINISATIAPVDSIGTVQITSANGNIATSFTKTADHKFLRFAFSGVALGNVAGSVVLSIGGVTKMTWTTQGSPVTVQNNGGIGTGMMGGPFAVGHYWSGAGSLSGSSMITGQDWFDITSNANGALAIAVTFTNITNGSSAIYRNRVG